jgi:hypothetical protein
MKYTSSFTFFCDLRWQKFAGFDTGTDRRMAVYTFLLVKVEERATATTTGAKKRTRGFYLPELFWLHPLSERTMLRQTTARFLESLI